MFIKLFPNMSDHVWTPDVKGLMKLQTQKGSKGGQPFPSSHLIVEADTIEIKCVIFIVMLAAGPEESNKKA